MCGITGIVAFNDKAKDKLGKTKAANERLSLRGPDGGAVFYKDNCSLGHRRLSIIDTSDNATQPMTDANGRYTIIFNGEIFNYKELKEQYIADKQDWHSQSDTEVLLELYIRKGKDCLPLLSGFFAFAIYDSEQEELFIARDRFGKKPVLYYNGDDYFAFASEMKALFEYGIPRSLNHTTLLQYLQLNYIPPASTMIEGVKKLAPGHYCEIKGQQVKISPYYKLNWKQDGTSSSYSYEAASAKLEQLMDESVKKRMISDVPLGAFLSGGIDSSVVVALASRYTQQLNTFSIGYKDNPFFDETSYAQLVAKKYNTNHTVFSLTNDDFLEYIDDVLNYIDEPFADSSAIPVYILSQQTRKHVTVALSGDGGDEVFAGYNKHQAEWRMRQHSLLNTLVKGGGPLWKILPQSRNNKLTNIFRQLNRFAEGGRLNVKERYWRWAGFLTQQGAGNLLTKDALSKVNQQVYADQRNTILDTLKGGEAIEDFLAADMKLVLAGDMLVKVDMMSMANSLEVRSPFLDHEVVDFAFSLPTAYKIDGKMKKRIVQDAFRKYLPEELYNRPKKGFEIPLLDWFQKQLRSRITHEWLNDKFIEEQGLFDVKTIQDLKAKLFSNNPGDSHATVWALIVFQHWYKKYMI